jgi:hypothetical protein
MQHQWLNSAVEKLHAGTSGAKALTETKGFIAAVKTLRHPKSEFFSKLFNRLGFTLVKVPRRK